MKVRDLQRRLLELGARPVRISGSHEVWELPDGHSVPIVVKRLGDDVSAGVLAAVARSLRRAGLELRAEQ